MQLGHLRPHLISCTHELHLDNKITIARSPLKRTRSVQEQNDIEAYLRHIGSSALYNFSAIESLVRATSERSNPYMASPPGTLAVVQNIIRLNVALRLVSTQICLCVYLQLPSKVCLHTFAFLWP